MSEVTKVTQKEIAREWAELEDLTIKRAEELQASYWGVINGHVAKRSTVSIFNQVKFEAKDRASRKGRNPQTGEEITIEAHTALKTTAFKKMKDLARHGE